MEVGEGHGAKAGRRRQSTNLATTLSPSHTPPLIFVPMGF